jgi:hypothetical protein
VIAHVTKVTPFAKITPGANAGPSHLSVSAAVVASVSAIAQAHAAFPGTVFSAVLFADNRIEG